MSLRFHLAPGRGLRSALRDELHALRRRNVRLKPETDPEVDRAIVERWFDRASWVAWCEDRQGRARAMCTWRTFAWHDGRAPRVGIAGEFFFIDPGLRASPFTAYAALRVALRVLLDARASEVWVGAAGAYLQSSLALARQLGEVVYLGEPGLGDEARRFLCALVEASEASLSEDDLVTMRTVPPEVSAGWVRRHEGEDAYRRYLVRNPRWHEGVGVVIGAKVSGRAFRESARVFGRRLVRRRPSRPAG